MVNPWCADNQINMPHKDRIINNLNLNKVNKTFTLPVNYKVFHLVCSISIDLIGYSNCLFLAFSNFILK